MGQRVTRQNLATIWNLSTERVAQFDRSGRIQRGPDGRYDLAAALAFRKAQVSEDVIQTMCKTYGSRHGTITPPKLNTVLAREQHALSRPDALSPPRPSPETEEALIAFANFVLTDILYPLRKSVPDSLACDPNIVDTVRWLVCEDTAAGIARIAARLREAGIVTERVVPET